MGKKRSPEQHYACMTHDDILRMPVACVAEKDSVLMLWCTWPKLEQGLQVMDAWGFSYRTGFPWLKVSRDMMPRIGTGYHTRVCSEMVLIGTKGKPRSPLPSDRMAGVLIARQGSHSAKPDALYSYAENYAGPYLEIFARPAGALFPLRDGWIQIGNEITGRDICEDLCLLAEASE